MMLALPRACSRWMHNSTRAVIRWFSDGMHEHTRAAMLNLCSLHAVCPLYRPGNSAASAPAPAPSASGELHDEAHDARPPPKGDRIRMTTTWTCLKCLPIPQVLQPVPPRPGPPRACAVSRGKLSSWMLQRPTCTSAAAPYKVRQCHANSDATMQTQTLPWGLSCCAADTAYTRGLDMTAASPNVPSALNPFFRYASLGFTGDESGLKWSTAPSVDWRLPQSPGLAAVLPSTVKEQGPCGTLPTPPSIPETPRPFSSPCSIPQNPRPFRSDLQCRFSPVCTLGAACEAETPQS